MVLDMKQVLKPEQWERLTQMREEVRERRRATGGGTAPRESRGDEARYHSDIAGTGPVLVSLERRHSRECPPGSPTPIPTPDPGGYTSPCPPSTAITCP